MSEMYIISFIAWEYSVERQVKRVYRTDVAGMRKRGKLQRRRRYEAKELLVVSGWMKGRESYCVGRRRYGVGWFMDLSRRVRLVV